MDREINKSNTESIYGIIEQIDKGSILLPEFQRDFVWEISRTFDLFDSLIKDIFVGSIIYGKPSFEVTIREIDRRERKKSGKRRKSLETQNYTCDEIRTKEIRLLLDGQQRLTSIYRAFKGYDEIWFVTDLSKVNSESSLEMVVTDITHIENEDMLSIRLSDIYKAIKDGMREHRIKDDFFSKLKFVKTLEASEEEKAFESYLILQGKIHDLIKSEKLLSYFLLDMDTEKFALFFERSNSTGIKLNFTDILTAKLYCGFNLRKSTEEFEEQYGFSLDLEIIVRTISYLVKGKVDKGTILSELNYKHFEEHWGNVCSAYAKVIEYLKDNNFIVNRKWMPYINMVIPLIIFVINLPKKSFTQMNEMQKEYIIFWFWASIFSQRYAYATNEVVVKDADNLKKIALIVERIDLNYLEKLSIPFQNENDLFGYDQTGNAVYKGILNLVNYSSGGIINWQNTSKPGIESVLEDHHIYPKKYLEELNDEELFESVNSVLNRALIPKLTNLKIGKKSPSSYLEELSNSNGSLIKSLKSHLIPEKILDSKTQMNFKDFLDQRAKLIFCEIKKIADEGEKLKKKLRQ